MKCVALILVAIAACSDPNPLLAELPHAPSADLAAACDLARLRCSRCHTIDRIIHTAPSTPLQWQDRVHRMRLIPGSAIRPDEEPTLVHCFVTRAQEVP